MEKSLRLQVYLSHQGVCSRRKAMDYIFQGRVALNGQTVREPSTPVHPGKDKIMVDGKPVEQKTYDYILLNKPQGYITTRQDRFAEKTVFDLLPQELRHVHPVGRLDKDTEGVLLLTNDGDLTLRLSHPRFEIQKIYEVRIQGHLKLQDQKQLEQGIVLEGKKTFPSKIFMVRRVSIGPSREQGVNAANHPLRIDSTQKEIFGVNQKGVTAEDAPGMPGVSEAVPARGFMPRAGGAPQGRPLTSKIQTEFHMRIHEGRKRQIRLMLASLGYRVVYLKRIQQGPLTLGNLKTGSFRSLYPEEVDRLKRVGELTS